MQPPPPHRLAALDGVRAVAALAVVITHVAFQTASVGSGPLGAIQGRLDSGVAVFFALSGFLLVRPWLAGAEPTTGVYAARRMARVLPAYWAAMVVALIVDAPGATTVAAHPWLGQVYVGTLLDDFSQTWSLSAEVLFYAVLPLAAPLLARRNPRSQLRLLAGAAVTGLVLTSVVRAIPAIPGRVGFWMPLHLAWFAGGIALAVVTTHEVPRCSAAVRAAARNPATVWTVAVLLLAVGSTPLAGPLTLEPAGPYTATAKELLYAVVATLVLAPFVTEQAGPAHGLRAAVQSGAGRWFGRISYGIFLWHLLVLHAVFVVTGRARFTGGEAPVLVLTVAGSVAVAAASWYLLEAPIVSRVHRGRAGARAAARAAAGAQPPSTATG